ncbi:PREDICTED: poly(A) RNA polymerase, mitochondrial isoform X2 [Cyphomyrmex costatus]|uniref:Poly(A) RNA polymerase, mitochondrial n=1 Tax=Cyphomyrmex costatus TaxID=456900 RepID=A0A195CYI5_9HYME|nr:PREDICTED: poly(A) RNA polymerase, mitochondrial isoform X2 [Cyphomyrmex costatus]KYN05718.1 Poly(A) RNA polymerase, mitochondrial [Cyphomyrmex costatus]
MALFGRANSNTFSLLSHCYCKKFIMGTSRLKSRGRISVTSTVTQHKNNKQESTLEAEITRRRNQACRSLLIQVYSSRSYNDLHNYCLQFGNVLSMHHYHINNQQNYILVEFKDTVSINQVMSSASFANGYITPVKSSVLWFRKGQSTTSQKNNQQKLPLFVENGCPLHTEAEKAKLLYNAKSISGQIIILYETMKLTDLEIRLRFHTAHHLEQYFSRLFQNIKVLPFGSSLNGFGRRRCDLDLVLVPDDTRKHDFMSRLVFHTKSMNNSDRNETKEFLGILANTMQHFIPGILNVRRILEARVPIIKFRYNYTFTECDLSATNMTAIYMTELLNFYGEMDWRVRPLVIAIRVWAKSQELTLDVPGQWITNFPLTLLVLFFLQQKKILPSLKTLKLYATSDDVRCAENGIDCTFLRDISKLPPDYKYKTNQDSLETLLYDFFEYYSTFDFQMYGICIREGVQIRKPSRSALHITNPLETTLNVCKNVSLYELNRIISKSHDAIYMLETTERFESNSWGIMTLLKMNNDNIVNLKKSNTTKEQTKNIEEYSEDNSYEISDKFEVSEVNIDETKTKKEETV